MPWLSGTKMKVMSPDLALENVIAAEIEQRREGALAHHVQHIDDNIADHNAQHQVGNTEAGMLIAEAVNLVAEKFHSFTSPVFCCLPGRCTAPSALVRTTQCYHSTRISAPSPEQFVNSCPPKGNPPQKKRKFRREERAPEELPGAPVKPRGCGLIWRIRIPARTC